MILSHNKSQCCDTFHQPPASRVPYPMQVSLRLARLRAFVEVAFAPGPDPSEPAVLPLINRLVNAVAATEKLPIVAPIFPTRTSLFDRRFYG